MRVLLQDLPQGLQDAVDRKAGGVLGFAPARGGGRAHLAGTARTPTGLIFIKGVRVDDDTELPMLRAEAANLFHAAPLAPRLIWQLEQNGWLLLGLERIQGRHARYNPGSPDLQALAEALARHMAAPDTGSVAEPYARRLAAEDAEVDALAGNHLIHADLNPGNVLVTPEGAVRVVDWGFCARGAAWLEPALVLPWLILAGHTPAQAQAWADGGIPGFADLAPARLDLLAALLHQRWNSKPRTGLAARYAAAVATWHQVRTQA